jgi:hypothetical protein
MAKSFYRNKITKLIEFIDDDFAALFPALEPVSEAVAEKGVTVYENRGRVEAEESVPVPVVTVVDGTDSPKGGK